MFHYPADLSLPDGTQTHITLEMDCLVAAGYTGRNQKSVTSHIKELKELGVPTPYATPALYWVSPRRLVADNSITVVGEQTSPEVEFFIAADDRDQLYITVASDHTDRELETVSVGKAKQVCDKVLGDVFWRVSDIDAHWDEIQLQSQVLHEGNWQLYQSGKLAEILPYNELLSLAAKDSCSGSKLSLLSGTIPIIGGETRYTSQCEITMTDPVLGRSITKTYSITSLPDRS